MILLGAGEIKDCKYNAEKIYKKSFEHKELNLTPEREREK